jgi:ribonuclease I
LGSPSDYFAAARKARDEIKEQLRGGLDPSHEKNLVKLQRSLDRENTFEAIAREWHEQWKERHAARIMKLLEREIFPSLGTRPID